MEPLLSNCEFAMALQLLFIGRSRPLRQCTHHMRSYECAHREDSSRTQKTPPRWCRHRDEATVWVVGGNTTTAWRRYDDSRWGLFLALIERTAQITPLLKVPVPSGTRGRRQVLLMSTSRQDRVKRFCCGD